jgi:membrane fusion protein, multidrug efflux system
MKDSIRAGVLAILPVCLFGCSGSHQPSAPVDPIPVVVTTAQSKSIALEVDAVGTVEPLNSVQVKSRVDGQLVSAAVTDGQDVKAGDLLFRIDPRPIQAQIEESLATIARNQAQIDQARTETKRLEPMAEKGFVSSDQMDIARTNERIATGALKVEQANLEGLKLQLSFTEIRAPIGGRVGRILVQPGNLVKANDTAPLLVLNQLAPIYVSFALPQRYLGDLHTASANGKLATRARIEGIDEPEHGEVAFVDNAVDTTTGTVKLRALFANEDRALWPGQFVNVMLALGGEDNAVVVPDVAVQAGPDGNYVFVVRNEQEVEQRSVNVDRSQNGETIIGKGLTSGETVVVDGQSRLVNGSLVTMTRTLQ